MDKKRISKLLDVQSKDFITKKVIDTMISKSENYWNKLMTEQYETLNKTTYVQLLHMSEEVYLKNSQELNLIVLMDSKASLTEGRILVNSADPTNLCWSTTSSLKNKINLTDLYKSMYKASRGVKVKYDNPEGFDSRISEEVSISKNSIKQQSRSLQKNGSTINEKSPADTPKKNNSSIKPSDSKDASKLPEESHLSFIEDNLYEDEDALIYLRNAGVTDPDINPECLVLISYKKQLLFILFESPEVTDNWINAFKLLIKCQNLSYRGIKDEYIGKKKEHFKALIANAEVAKELNNRNFLVWILDLEIDNYLYRELKIIFGTSKKESSVFLIIDVRKDFNKVIKSANKLFQNENFLNYSNITSILMEIEVTTYLTSIKKEFDVKSEITCMSLMKHPIGTHQKSMFYTLEDELFWDHRRRVIKNYKRLNPSLIDKVFNQTLESLGSSNNSLLRAVKILQLQKHEYRLQNSKSAKISYKKRGQRGGKKSRKRNAYLDHLKEKNVTKTTASVLKLMMFEEIRPELIPKNIKNVNSEKEKQRNDCCLIH